MIQAEAQHRDHAIVEQVFADLSCGPLAHPAIGAFPGERRVAVLAAICHRLTRAAGFAWSAPSSRKPAAAPSAAS